MPEQTSRLSNLGAPISIPLKPSRLSPIVSVGSLLFHARITHRLQIALMGELGIVSSCPVYGNHICLRQENELKLTEAVIARAWSGRNNRETKIGPFVKAVNLSALQSYLSTAAANELYTDGFRNCLQIVLRRATQK